MAKQIQAIRGMNDCLPEQSPVWQKVEQILRQVVASYGYSEVRMPIVEQTHLFKRAIGEVTDVVEKEMYTFEDRNGDSLSLRPEGTASCVRAGIEHGLLYNQERRMWYMGPMFRHERPQKGRYREFYQCDADVVGSDSLLNEVELMQIVDTVFTRFGIRVCIKINNRKILSGIAEIIGEADKIVDITVAIEKLATLKQVLSASETGLKGVEESEFILKTLSALGLKNEIELDLTLARGLNYYTGAIFEVKALDVQIGSITGGGRYDNLTGVFGMAGVSGVGISFGADRIFDVLNQLELYPKEAVNGTQLLFINFGEKEAAFSMNVLTQVRAAGIRAEIFPDSSKMKKQMGYANSKMIPFVALVGENEMNEGKVMLKNMETGEQNLVSAEELIAAVKR